MAGRLREQTSEAALREKARQDSMRPASSFAQPRNDTTSHSASFPLGGGYDPVIGQSANTRRPVSFVAPDGSQVQATLMHPLVTTTGAAYLFSPSRKALETYFGA
jgi:hypothetical protein